MSKSVSKLLIATYMASPYSDCLLTVIIPHNSDTKEIMQWKNKFGITYRVIPNDPVSGIELIGMCSTGNTKWWKIKDPRGFESRTISSSCILDILQGPGIVNGVLQGSYVWNSKTIITAV